MPEASSQPSFSLGQIVQHLRYGYRGVIVGWDPRCQAEDEWYEAQMRGKAYRPTKDQPWYHVLVHQATHTTYVAQQNLAPDPSLAPVEHPQLLRFFSSFFEGRYHREALN
mgnify:CR=1 FL=1